MSLGPEGPEPSRKRRRIDPLPWLGIGLLAFFLLSYPWLSPFAQGRGLFGIPLILWYVFGVWGLLILLGALRRPGI